MAQENIEYVRCIDSDIEAASIMNGIPSKTLQTLLRRMGIDSVDGLPREAYLIAWLEAFCEEKEWILRILPKAYLQFLIELWDASMIEMDSYRWDLIQYLKLFGLITYKKGNKANGEASEIYIVDSMKKNFYFYLKGRDSKKIMEIYERWDTVFSGLSYYYGMLYIEDYYKLFCQCLKEEVRYETFESFIKCRADVWGLGSFLIDSEEKELFMNHNVEEPETTFLFIREHKDLDYKRIPYKDLEYIHHMAGIDNRWPGISELGSYLLDKAGLSYYRATVFVQTVLVAIQNGAEFQKVKEQLDMLSFEEESLKEVALQHLTLLYENVPIYEYKGYTRKEFVKIDTEKEWKIRRKRFTMLTGGID